MAGTISENYQSRRFGVGSNAGRELVFDVIGTESETEVQTLLAGAAPASYLGLAIDSVEAEPLGGGVWKGYARYTRIADDSEYTFDTSGGTTKITQSLATVNGYAPTGLTAPDFQGAIGVSSDRVEGCDVIVPVFTFSETHTFDDSFILAGYRVILFNLTGRTNAASFKGLAAGECLFLGASGAKRADTRWAITFRFSGSPNLTGQTIGDITGIDKKGWEYLWVRYHETADSAAHALVSRPAAVYVERVYLSGDFSTLAIGV